MRWRPGARPTISNGTILASLPRWPVANTPACSNSACLISWREARAEPTWAGAGLAVASAVSRCPAADRAAFTVMIGMMRATPRAVRANLRGFPNESR
jgi:hypothetical protein